MMTGQNQQTSFVSAEMRKRPAAGGVAARAREEGDREERGGRGRRGNLIHSALAPSILCFSSKLGEKKKEYRSPPSACRGSMDGRKRAARGWYASNLVRFHLRYESPLRVNFAQYIALVAVQQESRLVPIDRTGRRSYTYMAAVLEPASVLVLPIDVLVDVFRRLVPRSLAASRCVCREWHDIVDGCRLLRRDLLPLTLRGCFVRASALDYSKFFSRPSTGPSICGELDFLPCDGVEVTNHCNGLLICTDWQDRVYVVNPATRGWTLLPPFPPRPCARRGDRETYLAYDPTISPRYEVFLIPIVPASKLDPTVMNLEWPPASYMIHVFSSTTRRWEKRTFAREDEATWIIVDDKAWSSPRIHHKRHSVYWRGALYVHCHHDSVIRMSLKNDKYQIITSPTCGHQSKGYQKRLYLGRSLKGVYCTTTYDSYRFEIWHLNESGGQMQWLLEHQVCLKTFAFKLRAREYYHQQMGGPWRLTDADCRNNHHEGDHDESTMQEKYEWSSDDDNVLDVQDWIEEKYSGFIHFLGFHPFKEVAFFNVSFNRGVAYHWRNSKFQDLGSLCQIGSEQIDRYIAGIDVFFPYTPCWMEEFLESHSEADLQG